MSGNSIGSIFTVTTWGESHGPAVGAVVDGCPPGITSGQPLVIRVATKPIPSIGKTQQTIDLYGNARELSVRGRHDVATIPRIVPVCEVMVNIVLADHLLRQKAIEAT